MNCQRYGACLRCLLYLLVALIVVAPWFAEARIRHYQWSVKYEYKSPDCYEKLVITVNGQFPGPTIKAQVGDTIYVDVTNQLETEGVSIHFHGIRQYGTPWSDGAADVTQCPILPGETFVYKFKVDRAGTFFYHAHYGMQRTAGLHGSIQVAVANGVKEPFSYHGEYSLLLNDWWHKSHTEQATGLSSIPFVWVNDPQSVLIEGRGSYNCSLVKSTNNSAGSGSICNSTNLDCSPPFNLSVVPGQTYRLRIANVASLSALNFLIEGHNLTVVEADSNYVEPFVVENLNVYPGETYSVLIRADQNPSRNYWIAVNVRGSSASTTPTGRAILIYNRSSLLPPSTLPKSPLWNDTAYTTNQAKMLKGRAGYVTPPPIKSNKLIMLLTTQNIINGYIRWSVNNISSVRPHTPFLIAVKYRWKKAFDQFPAPENYSLNQSNPNATYGNPIYRLEFNSTVDVILQNGQKLGNTPGEIHPWHLHGHDFWVLAQGNGTFDPLKDTDKFNLINPPKKNTVPLFAPGWTAIRFIADNPGVWTFHCHIDPHFFLGMGVVFEEGAERIGRLPRSIMGCGGSKALLHH